MKNLNRISNTNQKREKNTWKWLIGKEHQQSAQMTTNDLQATLQDLLDNNYKTYYLTYCPVTLQLVAPKNATMQISVAHVRLHRNN